MFTTHFQITKVDAERREVAGIITCQKEDKDGETLDYDGSKPEFQKWSQEAYEATKALGDGKQSFGNLREQHSKRAVGKFVQPIQFNDSEKSIYGVAKVYDDDVWQKVSDGVYNAFSVGGMLVGTPKWQGKTKFITISPREVSLVDNPALDATHFDFVRSADAAVVKMAFKHRTELEKLGDSMADVFKATSYSMEEIGQVLDHIKEHFQEELNEEQEGSEKIGTGVSGGSGEVAAAADPALAPVGNPAQNPALVAPKAEKNAYAPDAVPDGHKPEATQPVDAQAHLCADVKTTPDIPKLEAMGAPDTQLGKKPTEENDPESMLMVAKDGASDFKEGESTPVGEIPVDPLKPTGAQIAALSELVPYNPEKAAKIELHKSTTGAPKLMANEIEKAARLGLTGHLANLKQHADKLKQAVDGAHAAIHETAEKMFKLAGPAFESDEEHEGGQKEPLGDSSAAQDTEVKAAKAEIEKLAGLVKTLSEQVATLASAKPAEKTETEKAAKSESVVGDPAKAQPVDQKDEVAKAAVDAKEQEGLLTLAKAAMGISTVDGKTVRVNADPKAMDILYKKLTNATQYQAARKYMTQGQ